MNYNEAIGVVDALIKSNGTKAISGQVLNGVLKDIAKAPPKVFEFEQMPEDISDLSDLLTAGDIIRIKPLGGPSAALVCVGVGQGYCAFFAFSSTFSFDVLVYENWRMQRYYSFSADSYLQAGYNEFSEFESYSNGDIVTKDGGLFVFKKAHSGPWDYSDVTFTSLALMVSDKADKVGSATSGNFAALDGNGNLTDSGHKHSDYLTSHQDLSNYVKKSQKKGFLKNDGTVDTTRYGTYSKPSGGIPAADLASGVIPTVPTISTDIASDAFSDTKTASPKAVKTFVENKGYGTYSKPTDGIPASDLESGVIPTVPTISTNVVSDKTSDTKTSSPKSVYNEIHPAVGSSQPAGGMLPNVLYNLGTLSGSVTIALAAPSDNAIENEYRFTFTADSTAPTITWPNTVTKWIGNSLDNGAPKVEASTYYEVSIEDGYGIFNAF